MAKQLSHLYHRVMTRLVSGTMYSLLWTLESPKSASFKMPSLFMRRFEPEENKISFKHLHYVEREQSGIIIHFLCLCEEYCSHDSTQVQIIFASCSTETGMGKHTS